MPVPRTLHLGDADSPLGAPFYVMERVRRAHLPQRAARRLRRHARASGRAIGEGLVDVLADLHAIDPAEVGLAEFGRPDGFMERQLRRWSQAVGGAEGRPTCRRSTRCATSSSRTLPEQPVASIVHGDYRLDNTILAPDPPGLGGRGARLGDEHARRPVHRPRRAAVVLGRGVRPRRPAGRANRRARDEGQRLPVTRRGGRALRAAHRFRRVGHRAGTRRSPTSSSRSSARASPRAPPGARWWARASTTPSASSGRWSPRAGTCSAPASSH